MINDHVEQVPSRGYSPFEDINVSRVLICIRLFFDFVSSTDDITEVPKELGNNDLIPTYNKRGRIHTTLEG